MAHFLAFTRTFSADYDTLAAPSGASLDLDDVAKTFRQVSREGRRDVWGIVVTRTHTIVGLFIPNDRMLGDDSPYVADAGGRKILSFFGMVLESGDVIPEHDALEGEFRTLLRDEANAMLSRTWRRSYDREDTGKRSVALPGAARRGDQALDMVGTAAVAWPAADAGRLWNSMRATGPGSLDDAAIVLLNSELPVRQLPIPHGFLGIASDAVAAKSETRRVREDPSLQERETATNAARGGHRVGADRDARNPAAPIGAIVAIGAALAALLAWVLAGRR